MGIEFLEELEAKAKAAAKGPWQADKIGNVRDSNDEYVSLATIYGHRRIPGVPNAEYIAAVSPDVVLGMIERIKKLEKMCAWLTENMRFEDGDLMCPDTTEKCPLWADYSQEQDTDVYDVDFFKKKVAG